MQILNVNSRWSYEGKVYRISGVSHVKWADGKWYPAVTYWSEVWVPGAPNTYTRLTEDFIQKFTPVE